MSKKPGSVRGQLRRAKRNREFRTVVDAQLAKRRSQADSRAMLESIADLMSGKEWSADTLDAIRDILVNAGYTIKDVE